MGNLNIIVINYVFPAVFVSVKYLNRIIDLTVHHYINFWMTNIDSINYALCLANSYNNFNNRLILLIIIQKLNNYIMVFAHIYAYNIFILE